MNMKIRFLSSVMLSLLCSWGAAQTAVKVEGVNYLLNPDEGTAQIAKNSEAQGTVIIPDSILYNDKYYQVTAMVNAAFSEARLSSVSLPDAITTLNSSAFYKCKYLRQVKWPANLRVIGDGAFFMCEALESAMLPKGVKELQDDAFWRCGSLRELSLGDSLEVLGHLAFSHCEKLESVVLPATLKNLSGGAFFDCHGLRLIDCRIPEPIRMKDGNSFANAMKYFGVLRVPSKSRNAYRHHADWSTFVNIEEDNGGKEMVDVHVRCNDLGTVTIDGKRVKGQEGNTADLWLEAERGTDLKLVFTPVIGMAYSDSETEVSQLTVNGDSIHPFTVHDNCYVISHLAGNIDIDVAFSIMPRQLMIQQAEGGSIGIRYGMYESVLIDIQPEEGVKANAFFNDLPELYWSGYWNKVGDFYNFNYIWEDTKLLVNYVK
jgi:hypothetical protein